MSALMAEAGVVQQTAYNILCCYKPGSGSVCTEKSIPYKCMRLHQLHIAVIWVLRECNYYGFELGFDLHFGPYISNSTKRSPWLHWDIDELAPGVPCHGFLMKCYKGLPACAGVYVSGQNTIAAQGFFSSAFISAIIRSVRAGKQADGPDPLYKHVPIYLINHNYAKRAIAQWLEHLIKRGAPKIRPKAITQNITESWSNFFEFYARFRETYIKTNDIGSILGDLTTVDDFVDDANNPLNGYEVKTYIGVKNDTYKNVKSSAESKSYTDFLKWFDDNMLTRFRRREKDITLTDLKVLKNKMYRFGISAS